MDKRNKRRENSREAIVAAIDRLKRGEGTHPRHIGIRVRITKEAIAKEARVSSATLYRCPDLLQNLQVSADEAVELRQTRSQQRLAKAVRYIAELEGRLERGVAENARLMELLSKYDPLLGETTVTSIEDARMRKKGPS